MDNYPQPFLLSPIVGNRTKQSTILTPVAAAGVVAARHIFLIEQVLGVQVETPVCIDLVANSRVNQRNVASIQLPV